MLLLQPLLKVKIGEIRCILVSGLVWEGFREKKCLSEKLGCSRTLKICRLYMFQSTNCSFYCPAVSQFPHDPRMTASVQPKKMQFLPTPRHKQFQFSESEVTGHVKSSVKRSNLLETSDRVLETYWNAPNYPKRCFICGLKLIFGDFRDLFWPQTFNEKIFNDAQKLLFFLILWWPSTPQICITYMIWSANCNS